MPTLEQLKAEHPEWCFSCGAYFTGSAEHHLYCVERRSWDDPMLSALIAAKLEDEAKIAELKDDLKVQIGRSEGKNIIIHELEAKLSAEQAAHAATKEALRKAEETIQQQARKLEGAARDVFAERRRQVEAEGWTPQHDDAHDNGELATAAACYAEFADADWGYNSAWVPENWPWARDWWKPGDQRRMLVKAGALILAEIERLDRIHSAQAESEAKKEVPHD